MTDQIHNAMKVLSALSSAAKDAGDKELMYAANRGWRELWAVSVRRPPSGQIDKIGQTSAEVYSRDFIT